MPSKAIMRKLKGLTIADNSDVPKYYRSHYGSWRDEDGDGQNTRAEVLILNHRPKTGHPLEYASSKERRVVSGRWRCMLSGKIYTLASDVDIDHHVPLKAAHVAGAHAWPKDKKRRYANGYGARSWARHHLSPVDDSLNRKKGSKAPDQWKPPWKERWAHYATMWIRTKHEWQLSVTQAEYDALVEMLNTPGPRG